SPSVGPRKKPSSSPGQRKGWARATDQDALWRSECSFRLRHLAQRTAEFPKVSRAERLHTSCVIAIKRGFSGATPRRCRISGIIEPQSQVVYLYEIGRVGGGLLRGRGTGESVRRRRNAGRHDKRLNAEITDEVP